MSKRPTRKKRKRPAKRTRHVPSAAIQRDPIVDKLLDQYEQAAGRAALIELKLRILAEKIPELEPFAHDKKLENVEAKVSEWFGERLTKEDAERLATGRRLRNKLLHGDFRAARDKLQEAGAPRTSGGVRRIVFGASASASDMLEKISAVAANEPGSSSLVSDDRTTADSGIFGWLLELGTAGDLQLAKQVFAALGNLVDRLISQADNMILERRTSSER